MQLQLSYHLITKMYSLITLWWGAIEMFWIFLFESKVFNPIDTLKSNVLEKLLTVLSFSRFLVLFVLLPVKFINDLIGCFTRPK